MFCSSMLQYHRANCVVDPSSRSVPLIRASPTRLLCPTNMIESLGKVMMGQSDLFVLSSIVLFSPTFAQCPLDSRTPSGVSGPANRASCLRSSFYPLLYLQCSLFQTKLQYQTTLNSRHNWHTVRAVGRSCLYDTPQIYEAAKMDEAQAGNKRGIKNRP